jgi:nucleosome binding factor SPN SPT16 subunit
MTGHLMSHFSDVMSTYIADNMRVSHEELGELIEAKLEDTKYWKKIELGDGVSFSRRKIT